MCIIWERTFYSNKNEKYERNFVKTDTYKLINHKNITSDVVIDNITKTK